MLRVVNNDRKNRFAVGNIYKTNIEQEIKNVMFSGFNIKIKVNKKKFGKNIF